MARYWNKYAKKAKKPLFRRYMSIKRKIFSVARWPWPPQNNSKQAVEK